MGDLTERAERRPLDLGRIALCGTLSPGSTIRLIIDGEYSVREIERLIAILVMMRDWIAEDASTETAVLELAKKVEER